ncbi:hypothetical protein VCHA53P481_60142 [Vibrio chagasii]|nr:hypothetical protein VCHA32O87_60097 [Vibrio chagasii]CAH7356352.1 hypothetical protein VCHA43P284_60128 [Vibrio chagasii]CAH7389314.1 hypothetical protein VCHA53P481_60142 [Vibrio chagasii]
MRRYSFTLSIVDIINDEAELVSMLFTTAEVVSVPLSQEP